MGIHDGHREKMRRRFLETGLEGFADHEALELLLYLQGLERPPRRETSPCQAEQIETVRAVHDLLTGDLARRVTIEELSRRFLINTSTLKSAFKAIYGMPIAAYMKEFRMHKAMKLLQDPSLSIAQIAAMLGYESQSKFARAFKEITGCLPTEYRRSSR